MFPPQYNGRSCPSTLLESVANWDDIYLGFWDLNFKLDGPTVKFFGLS